MDKIREFDLGQFVYDVHNSKNIVFVKNDDDWIEFIDTSDSIAGSVVVQCCKDCEVVSTKIMFLEANLQNNIHLLIKQIYGED